MGSFISGFFRGATLLVVVASFVAIFACSVHSADYGGPRKMSPAAKEVETDKSKFRPDELIYKWCCFRDRKRESSS